MKSSPSQSTAMLGAFILVGQLLASSYAFAPQTRPTLHQVTVDTSLYSTLSDKDADQKKAPLPIRVVKTPNNNNNNENKADERKHCLELDSVGRLRLCNSPDILLQGLDPETWSATRPANGKTNGLFLHTSHPESLPTHQTSLGDLISCRRLIACARQNRYWMGPKTGASAADIPFDTQFLLIEIEEDQQYALMLPLVDNGFRASINHHEGTGLEVVCNAESGDAAVTSKGMRALYVAVGNDPYELIKEGFANVAEATGTFDVLDHKTVPSSVDDFGWCTWDAFYSKVDPKGIVEGVKALKDAGVPPRTLILDDGWQQVSPDSPEVDVEVLKKDESMSSAVLNAIASPFVKAVTAYYMRYVRTASHGTIPNRIWAVLANSVLKSGLWNYFDSETDFIRQLNGFEANEKFEGNGKTLKSLVSELKTDLGVKNVYCWHALHGYWRGVTEDLGRRYGLNVTNIHPKPTESLMTVEPHAAWDPVSLFGVGIMTDEEDLKKFYELLHKPLVEAGVDGVKVDVQSGVSSAGDGVGGGPHISKIYMKAMETSVAKRFPSDNGAVNCINCMCHSTENLYRHKETSVARASEDFFPDRPESHTAHLVNVAYNSLFLGEICLPDWDMFHSLHESAALHGAARAIGGCPVYVSDKPGEHDPELLRKLVLPDGTLLRAQQPGRPTRDSLFVDVTTDGESALKVWNVNPAGGVVGAFNVQGVAWNFNTNENEVLNHNPSSVTAEVKPYDVESLRNTPGPFVAWRHREGTMEFLESGNSPTKAKLDHREWEIFTISPIQISGHLMWAPVGLKDMMNSGGAVTSPGSFESGAEVTRAQFESRGPGSFVAFTNTVPNRVLIDGQDKEIQFAYDKETGELSFDLPSEASIRAAHKVTVEWDH